MIGPLDASNLPDAARGLAELHKQLFDKAWTVATFSELLRHPGSIALVAEKGDGAAAGFMLARQALDEVEILTFGVAPEAQRQGLGSSLLDALIGACREARARRLILEVDAGNAAAISLYRAAGFAEIGRRKQYYAKPKGKRSDALVLALEL